VGGRAGGWGGVSGAVRGGECVCCSGGRWLLLWQFAVESCRQERIGRAGLFPAMDVAPCPGLLVCTTSGSHRQPSPLRLPPLALQVLQTPVQLAQDDPPLPWLLGDQQRTFSPRICVGASIDKIIDGGLPAGTVCGRLGMGRRGAGERGQGLGNHCRAYQLLRRSISCHSWCLTPSWKDRCGGHVLQRRWHASHPPPPCHTHLAPAPGPLHTKHQAAPLPTSR
jgi:hypothetical protein